MSLGDLSVERVQALLHTSVYGRSLQIEETTASTNDDARAAAATGVPDGHVIVADTQSKGRGSRGRTWVSPAGTDLYFSIVARVPLPLSEVPPLTLAVGVGVAEAIESFLPQGTPCQVKWPNDVWVAAQKCSGILLEGASAGVHGQPVVIGIGINVNRREFPDGLDTPPTSIALARGESVDRSEVLARTLDHVERWVDRFVGQGIAPVLAALEPRLAMRGELARCDDVEGIVDGITRTGALRMRTEHGTKDVLSGTLRPLQR